MLDAREMLSPRAEYAARPWHRLDGSGDDAGRLRQLARALLEAAAAGGFRPRTVAQAFGNDAA